MAPSLNNLIDYGNIHLLIPRDMLPDLSSKITRSGMQHRYCKQCRRGRTHELVRSDELKTVAMAVFYWRCNTCVLKNVDQFWQSRGGQPRTSTSY